MQSRILLLFLLCSNISFGQDSLTKTEDAIVISATRTLSSKQQVAVPITILSKAQITATGTLKLNELLSEQAGIFITNGSGSRAVGGGIFGNGVQMQGLSPDHILVLVDGEPMIGRNGGTLDLTRLTVGNVKQIEIIKGPFSSLFGSEAMGGVINIITEQPKTNNFSSVLRYGSFNTIDLQNKLSLSRNKTSASLFINNFSSNGYDLNSKDIEKTQDPWQNHTIQLKVNHQFAKSGISFSNRFFTGKQQSKYANNSNFINIDGVSNTKENASFISYYKYWNKNLKSSLNAQYNVYSYSQKLDSVSNGNVFYQDNFEQHFYRLENINELLVKPNNTLIFGGGITSQKIKTDRYAGIARQNAFHVFVQNEWNATNKLKLSTGVRYDRNSDFAFSINPKLALKYALNNRSKLWLSIGSGFKAPDFRQLYLDFINNASDSYIIYGTEAFSINKLQQQLSNNFIAQILPSAFQIKQLNPEKSIGLNVAYSNDVNKHIKIHVNTFYNKIDDLIQYTEIAKRANGALVYSYININKAFTTGAEFQANVIANKHFSIDVNYQYLKSGDRAILKNIKAGTVYGRNYVGGPARLLVQSDYKNLQGRSTHLAQLKLNYNTGKMQVSLRNVFRGKWAVIDLDGNGISNMDAEFAKANIISNISVQYKIKTNINTQLGCNNITNYKDAIFMTNQPCRNFYITLNYSIKNKNRKDEKNEPGVSRF